MMCIFFLIKKTSKKSFLKQLFLTSFSTKKILKQTLIECTEVCHDLGHNKHYSHFCPSETIICGSFFPEDSHEFM